MSKPVNMTQAKSQLSALVDRAAAGEEIVLSKAVRPVARLVPLVERRPRQPGVRREWQIPDDLFLEPAEEDLKAAEGSDTLR